MPSTSSLGIEKELPQASLLHWQEQGWGCRDDSSVRVWQTAAAQAAASAGAAAARCRQVAAGVAACQHCKGQLHTGRAYGHLQAEQVFGTQLDVWHQFKLDAQAAGCVQGKDGTYGTSLRYGVAMDPGCDVMVCFMQNGRLLQPDHGFPVGRPFVTLLCKKRTTKAWILSFLNAEVSGVHPAW